MRRALTAAALLLLGGPAWAQELEVTAEAGAEDAAGAGEVRRALEDELHGANARGVLTLAVDPAGWLVLDWCDGNRHCIRRMVTVTGDRGATAREVALIAANLVRDEAAEILAGLERPSPAPAIAAPAVTPVAADLLVSAPAPRAPPNRAVARPFAIGAEAYLSPRSAEIYAPTWGFSLAYTIASHLALGLNNLSLAPLGGETVLCGGPFVELSTFTFERLQLFAQVGAPLQVRWGGVLGRRFGAQPYAGGGARLWLGNFSVAAALRGSIVVTDAWAAPPTGTVRDTTALAGGIELAVHL